MHENQAREHKCIDENQENDLFKRTKDRPQKDQNEKLWDL